MEKLVFNFDPENAPYIYGFDSCHVDQEQSIHLLHFITELKIHHSYLSKWFNIANASLFYSIYGMKIQASLCANSTKVIMVKGCIFKHFLNI